MELSRRIGHSFIRNLTNEDLAELEKIHEKHFKQEFSLNSFFSNHIGAWVVGDDEGIITVATAHPILEISGITNKDRSPLVRKDALLRMDHFTKHAAKQWGYDAVYHFIQDKKWLKQIQNYGYRPAKGFPVIADVE